MGNSENTIFRLMNHDNLGESNAKFDKYTLQEYNDEFGTDYKTVQEATEADPQYLFSEQDVQQWMEAENQ